MRSELVRLHNSDGIHHTLTVTMDTVGLQMDDTTTIWIIRGSHFHNSGFPKYQNLHCSGTFIVLSSSIKGEISAFCRALRSVNVFIVHMALFNLLWGLITEYDWNECSLWWQCKGEPWLFSSVSSGRAAGMCSRVLSQVLLMIVTFQKQIFLSSELLLHVLSETASLPTMQGCWARRVTLRYERVSKAPPILQLLFQLQPDWITRI